MSLWSHVETKCPYAPIDKQDAVGGNGGGMFDSGCNFSRIRKVVIHSGPYHDYTTWVNYDFTIKRIFLEFEKPFQPQSGEKRTPSFQGQDVDNRYNENVKRALVLDENDAIVRIDVYTDQNLVNAVRFHLKSGLISELYGIPHDHSKPPISFEAKYSGSELVGIHGSFGKNIDRLGFTFACPPVQARTNIAMVGVIGFVSLVMFLYRKRKLVCFGIVNIILQACIFCADCCNSPY